MLDVLSQCIAVQRLPAQNVQNHHFESTGEKVSLRTVCCFHHTCLVYAFNRIVLPDASTYFIDSGIDVFGCCPVIWLRFFNENN